MDKNYCKKIDENLLVEKYVEGKLDPEEIQKFEKHLAECPVHAQAVTLEKALYRGISEYARSEIRSRLRRSVEKKDDIRYYILRYAAILFLVVITPLILYYQFYTPRVQDVEIPHPELLSPAQEKKPGSKTQNQSIQLTEDKSSGDVAETEAENDMSDKIVKRSALEDQKLSRPAPEIKAQEEELSGEAQRAERKQAEVPEPPSAAHALRKITTGEKSAARITAMTAAEMAGISRLQSEKFGTLEDKMRACIQRHKRSLSIEPFTLTYSFVIDTLGTTNEIKILRMSENIAGIDSCLKTTIQGWQFETASERQTVVRRLIVPLK
jgi:hypothetical protein